MGRSCKRSRAGEFFFYATSGVRYVQRVSDGRSTFFYNPAQAERVDVIIGHLINPQICGIMPSEVAAMNLHDGARIIDMVSKSNAEIAKQSKGD